jgi:hypothetical protein
VTRLNGARFDFLQGLKRYVDHPPPSSAEVKETVELYLYYLRPSWQVIE